MWRDDPWLSGAQEGKIKGQKLAAGSTLQLQGVNNQGQHGSDAAPIQDTIALDLEGICPPPPPPPAGIKAVMHINICPEFCDTEVEQQLAHVQERNDVSECPSKCNMGST